MADPTTIDWEPDEHDGWKADIGVLWFEISGEREDDSYTLCVGWYGDHTIVCCDSYEDGKRKAIEIARKILTDALRRVEASEP